MKRRDSLKVLLCVVVLVMGLFFGPTLISNAGADEGKGGKSWGYSAVPNSLIANKKYTYRFVQMSDTQPHPESELHWQRMGRTIDVVNSLGPDMVLFAGDITSTGTEAEYERVKTALQAMAQGLLFQAD